jgi:mono/diheme cytochrome c family protein
MRFTTRLAVLSCGVALATWTLGVAAQDHDHDADHHDAGAHTHPEAAKIKNPVKPTAASIAAGEKTYTAQCVACHGATGKGDGKMAAELNPKPPDLTDASWKHGSTDGEIFTLIKDGSKGTGMKGFASKLTATDIWNVVNYLRSIGPKSPPAH